mgnify:CR=1 FL=1
MKVFDLHCDTLSELRYAERRGEAKSFATNDLHIDLEKLHKGDYMLQCFAAFVNLSDPTPGADPLVTALEEVDVSSGSWRSIPTRSRRSIAQRTSAATRRPERSAEC